jgi:hypothetical protein
MARRDMLGRRLGGSRLFEGQPALKQQHVLRVQGMVALTLVNQTAKDLALGLGRCIYIYE